MGDKRHSLLKDDNDDPSEPRGWLVGGGEMGQLIREMDWSQSSLGPMGSWPQSLRTAVSICLGSRHPIVLWWGPERSMFYNDAYRPMLGERKHPQFLGGSGQECWAEIWDIIGPMMDQVLATGEATWSEDLLLLMLRSGYLEETYFTFSYSPIRDEHGQPRGVFNACTESTARVLSERRLRALRGMAVEARSTQEAAQRCADALGQNSRDVPFALVYLLTENGTLALAGQFGLAPGTPASPLSAPSIPGEVAAWPLATVVASAAAELVSDLATRFTCLPLAPWDEAARQALLLPIARPGSPHPAGVLVLGINPRRAFDDDYRGFFELVAGHVATSLANARAYEDERKRAEALAEIDRTKTAFFSNVSHEFRTPLTLILGPVEDALAEQRALSGENLEAVQRNAVRLLRLVNTLLDFSRVEAGRLQMCWEPTDLAAFTAGLAGSFQSLIEGAGLSLVVDCPTLPEPVHVDPSQWEKIVLNLVSNAFKFTFEGEIRVSLGWHEDHVALTVRDTGTGIPKHEQSRIFERFHRVEGTRGRSFEGTGIGLALVQELVKLHSGSIQVSSVEGQGTTFVVSIPTGTKHLPETPGAQRAPRAESAAAPFREAAHLGVAPPAESRSGGPAHGPAARMSPAAARILVAEDNADMREYLLRLLRPHWEVDSVVDGEEALAAVQRDAPDLVLSDVMMPRMDGVALLGALRADPRTTTIPVVLLSARAGEEAVVAGLETGADDYLVKPFSARELLTRVRTHLHMARVRKQWARDLELVNQELEAFSYSVSHDLRAPVRAIEGFSRVVIEKHGEQLDTQGKFYLERIAAATTKMSRLIDSLLELARVSRGKLRREPVPLTDLARELGGDLRQRHSGRQVDFQVDPGIVGNADRRLAAVVLENLLGNAWKFTEKKAHAHIHVGQRALGGETAFFVRDDGAGFDTSAADRLFQPFCRMHADSEFEGTGIGLATVHRIIARHGGRVWAESAVDQGATFFFTLPDDT